MTNPKKESTDVHFCEQCGAFQGSSRRAQGEHVCVKADHLFPAQKLIFVLVLIWSDPKFLLSAGAKCLDFFRKLSRAFGSASETSLRPLNAMFDA